MYWGILDFFWSHLLEFRTVMADDKKTSIYHGYRNVVNPGLSTSTATDNQNQSNVGNEVLFFVFVGMSLGLS